jgi:hypothetical protein
VSTTKYGKSELEALWVKAGGPKAEARVAAAIALAESGGVPTAKNPEGPEHAEGLWQIKGQLVSGNPFNPEVSAANAVAKWKDAKGFSPWTTFTGGEYKKFLGTEGSATPSGTILAGPLSPLLEGVEAGAKAAGGSLHIPNPFGEIETAGQFFKAITEPSTWLRIAEGLGGGILFFVGLKTLTKGSPAAGATNVAIQQSRSVKGVAVKAGKVVAGVAK